jgi:hypothetical protein
LLEELAAKVDELDVSELELLILESILDERLTVLEDWMTLLTGVGVVVLELEVVWLENPALAVAIGVLRIGAVGRKIMLVVGVAGAGGVTILVRAAAGVEKTAILVSAAAGVEKEAVLVSTAADVEAAAV